MVGECRSIVLIFGGIVLQTPRRGLMREFIEGHVNATGPGDFMSSAILSLVTTSFPSCFKPLLDDYAILLLLTQFIICAPSPSVMPLDLIIKTIKLPVDCWFKKKHRIWGYNNKIYLKSLLVFSDFLQTLLFLFKFNPIWTKDITTFMACVLISSSDRQ